MWCGSWSVVVWFLKFFCDGCKFFCGGVVRKEASGR